MYIFFKLEYTCLTMLCWFLLQNNENQLYAYIYPPPPEPPTPSRSSQSTEVSSLTTTISTAPPENKEFVPISQHLL